MALHSIHSCSKIFAENSELRLKIKWLIAKREELQQEVADIAKKFDSGKCKHCVKASYKNVGVQTESKPPKQKTASYNVGRGSQADSDSNVLKTNKLIEMHSQLLKRYDKEVQLNMSYADTISNLNVRLSESEKHLREMKEKNFILERDLILCKAQKKGLLPEDQTQGDTVLRDVVRERNKLAKENKEMRKELKSLDASFFDEIEDVKFALKQSVELNKKYEKSLKRLCHQFGLPFCPEIVSQG